MNIKKLIFLLLFVVPSISFSQNLEYSKVLLVSSIDTVPSGKVWKITNVLPTLSSSGELKILVNGNDIVVAFSKGTYSIYGTSTGTSAYNNDYHYNGLQGAYWLPEGTTLQSSDNVQYISVIEFNE